MKKIKILIAGIGGVGGYFGGLLANHFYNHSEVEIIFLSRGQNLLSIQQSGLKVIKGDKELICKPKLATDKPAEIGTVDFIIIATKTYHLQEIVRQLEVCINEQTIILPLLNGVDNREKILKITPNNLVLEGCVYIISRLTEAGKIENIGNIEKLFFGIDDYQNHSEKQSKNIILLEKLFKQANIDATLSTTISQVIWQKFIFISTIATATTYFDTSIGKILTDNEKFEIVKKLINEVTQLAKGKNITVSEDIKELTLQKLKSLPFETTSSMHFDFENKKQNTELESLTNYVVLEGQKYNVKTPIFSKFVSEIKARK
ncbi:ketopantoate reductase family protein [Bernardetia sp. OM2101]|uniref:ketopantoate reductase family protein n=1 Tax=Bernardetia sp. OM2101 TaxID=3344876 RepID=UPI0035D1380D